MILRDKISSLKMQKFQILKNIQCRDHTVKIDFKNFPLKTKCQKKIIFLHGAKNGGKGKIILLVSA